MTKTKTCKTCSSAELVPRGSQGFRNQCHSCWAKAQRESWAANREARLVASKANYAKHARKRREESATYKLANREYYALAEWFRKKGIPIGQVDPSDIGALIEMKKALNEAKAQTRQSSTQSATQKLGM